MRKRLLLSLGAASLLALAGCKDAPSSAPAAGDAAAAPISIDAIAAQAQGFSLGSSMSVRTAYVFFDPQCPHCAALWMAARPLRTQSRFVWIPVGVMGEKSTTQGAALLAASDPVAAMDQHEASMREKGGGIGPRGGTEQQQDAVKRNTAFFTRMGFNSVPVVVGRHAQSGEVVTIEGALPTQALAQRLGLPAP